MEKKQEKKEEIQIKDLSTWLKIAVIGWLVYLGFVVVSLIMTIISAIAGIGTPAA